MKNIVVCFFAMATLCCLPGCGPKTPEGFPKLYPTTMTVTQEGEPLEGAIVTMYTDDSNYRWLPAGTTDSSGEVKIYTQGKYPGAPKGKYKVCLLKSTADKIPNPPMDLNPEIQREYREKMKNFHPKRCDYVEPQYMNRKTTPLEIEIVAGKNSIPIDAGHKFKKETAIKFR